MCVDRKSLNTIVKTKPGPTHHQDQCSGRILGKISQNPSVSKSNWWHAVNSCLLFINLRHVLYISLERPVIFLKSWISINYFLISISSGVTSGRFFLFVDHDSCLVYPTLAHVCIGESTEPWFLIRKFILCPNLLHCNFIFPICWSSRPKTIN